MAKMDNSTGTVDTGSVLREDNSAGTFTDDTTDASSSTANDVTIPDPFDTNDALYIGSKDRYSLMTITVGTTGAGDALAAETEWEYYNGTAWATLTTVQDNTSVLTATGTVDFDVPSDWAKTSLVPGTPYFYIRFRATADDVFNTTQPIISQITLSMPSADRTLLLDFLQEAAGRIIEEAALNVPADATVSLTSGQDDYEINASPFPLDTIRILSIRLTDSSVTNEPMSKVNSQELDNFRAGSQATGSPYVYSVEWPRISLYPQPGSGASLKLRYIQESPTYLDDANVSISIVPDHFQWTVMFEYIMYRAMQYKKDFEASKNHLDAYAYNLRLLKKWRGKAGGRQINRQPSSYRSISSPSQDVGW